MKVLIVGGAGRMASGIIQDLLDIDSDEIAHVTLADINFPKLKERIEVLGSDKLTPVVLDISNHDALVRLIEKHDVVVNAAVGSTNLQVINAALTAGVNFIGLVGVDLPGSAVGAPLDELGLPTQSFKEDLESKFKEAGITALLGLGSMPGTSNLMGRYFGDMLDRVESMEFTYVYARLGETKAIFPFNPLGMIGQYTLQPVILNNGKLRRVPARYGREKSLFPEPIGMREVFNILHEEPVCFAYSFRNKGLKNAGTKAGWGPDIISTLELLDSLGLLDFEVRKVGDVSVVPARVLVSGLTSDDKKQPRDYGCTRLVIKGEKAGQTVEYNAEVLSRPYKRLGGTEYRTGIPAAIGIRMLGKGQITRKGAFSVEHGIDPHIYFKELSRRDLYLDYTIKHRVS